MERAPARTNGLAELPECENWKNVHNNKAIHRMHVSQVCFDAKSMPSRTFLNLRETLGILNVSLLYTTRMAIRSNKILNDVENLKY